MVLDVTTQGIFPFFDNQHYFGVLKGRPWVARFDGICNSVSADSVWIF